MKSNELLDQFVLESRECLEQIGDVLLKVERDPSDSALLNHLFRQVHTLKGNCGLFDFKPLEHVVHAGEDVLDQVRSGLQAYSSEMADSLLDAMDFVAQLVDEIERTGVIEGAKLEHANEIAQKLRAFLASPASVVEAVEAGKIQTDIDMQPDWVRAIPADVLQAHMGAIAWRYTPEPSCFFKGEDPWLYACQCPQVAHVKVQHVQPWPDDLAQWDCYACNLQLIGLSHASKEEIEAHFRYVQEQVEFFELPQEAVPATPSAVASEPLPDSLLQMARKLWNEQCGLLQKTDVALTTVESVRTVFASILKVLADKQSQESLASLRGLSIPVTAQVLMQWSQANLPPALTASLQAEEPASTGLRAHPATGQQEELQHKQLKISQEKIDRLMDLIGEMVVAKNALPYLAQRAEVVFQQRELAREIKAQYAVINRIAEDMQHAIMQVRMMPVGTVFQRFGRLVRDTSKRLGKDVQLVIEGEETEADKNVIEALADPLIHILRNSLDHGVELPEARKAAGKLPRGTIKVRASQESDRVIIEISDDGAGINTQRVRAKAVERGLVPADTAENLSEADAAQLVFLPGFSTADTISDLSGRGVGMDVVRSAVERINGEVDLVSHPGQGTQIRLSLPLSMAVTNVMIIEAAGHRFGVPMDLIVETVRVHQEDIHHFKQTSTTVLRGKIVPLRALHDMLDLGASPITNSDQEFAVLVVRLGDSHLGLLVDQFLGASDIILKPLEGVLAGLAGFSGTALMGDGSVLMVLNPKELR